MRQNRELTVTGSREAIARVVAHLHERGREQASHRPPGPWSLAAIPEQGRRTDVGEATYLILDFAGDGPLAGARAAAGMPGAARPARVWLTVGGEQVRLANLFVQGNDRLDDEVLIEANNRVVVRLHDDLLAPAAAAAGAHVELGPDAPDLADWMTRETADRLRRFSGAANQGTGIAHPNDRGRFFDFLLAAHAEGADLTAEDLEGWFREHGWSARHADQLARYYEFGRALLAHRPR